MEAKKIILVTGSSGLIGTELCAALELRDYTVRRLARGKGSGCWDPEVDYIDPAVLEGIDAVIHLAGENVAQRWWPAVRCRIYDSRIKGTQLLVQALLKMEARPDFIMASGINYYGFSDAEPKDEGSHLGEGFLASVCRDWEAAGAPWEAAGGRLVMVRTGMVLSAKGGALAKLLPPFKLGLGGPIGSGRQHMSWISIDDIVSVYLQALENKALSGPINAVAPVATCGAEFARELGAVLKRPACLPAPAFALKLAFGAMAKEVILSDLQIEPRRLKEIGFKWSQPNLASAFASVL